MSIQKDILTGISTVGAVKKVSELAKEPKISEAELKAAEYEEKVAEIPGQIQSLESGIEDAKKKEEILQSGKIPVTDRVGRINAFEDMDGTYNFNREIIAQNIAMKEMQDKIDAKVKQQAAYKSLIESLRGEKK